MASGEAGTTFEELVSYLGKEMGMTAEAAEEVAE
jgi:hypothetical protein